MHKNEFCYENVQRFSQKNFYFVGHYAAQVRTRTASSLHKEYNLVENSTSPKPVVTIKHNELLEDPIKEYSKNREKESYLRTRLEVRLRAKRKSSKIQDDDVMIDNDIEDYIRKKVMKYPTTYDTEKHCFDLNFNRGTLDFIEGLKHNSLAYVWNGDSVRFSRVTRNKLLQLNSTIDHTTPVPNELIIKPDNSDFIVVRYKDYVDIAKAPNYLSKYSRKMIIKPFDRYNHDGKEIVASCLQGKYLTTVNTNHLLQRYDIEHKMHTLSMNLGNNFVGDFSPVNVQDQITHTNRNNFMAISTRHNFGLIDCRAKKNCEMTKIVIDKDHMLMNCEKIMNHTASKLDNNIVYIASSHILYAFDYRKLKEPIVQWAHHLKKPAFLIKTELYGTHEVICLSSHRSDDFVLFNYSNDEINYLPFKPKTLHSTYNNFREQGEFLLSDDIKERMHASTTGMALQTDPLLGKINVYTQNHYGDIFEHTFNCKSLNNSKGQNENLNVRYREWEQFLTTPCNPNKQMTVEERLRRSEIVVSDIARLEGVSKILTGEQISITDLVDIEPENQKSYEAPWKMNIHDARQYNDLLAIEIMQVWDDIEIEETRPAIFAQALDASNIEKGGDKVSLWLESTTAADNSQSLSMPNEFMDMDFESTMVERHTQEYTPKAATSTPARKKPRFAGF